MSNELRMDTQKAIKALREQGWSLRRISEELGIHRNTVKRYVLENEDGSKCTISPTGIVGRKSHCERFEEQIKLKFDLGLDAQRIHQDLVVENGFCGSYYSVQRYVKKLKKVNPHRVWRMECEPAQEAQIDFGVMNLLDQGSGRLSRVNLFRITLSYSRKSYSEAVLNQSCESFLRCIENAFRYFGGVPLRLCVDNLKAAVIKAHWYDPDLNPKIMSFAEHYGTTVMPTRPRTPEHKGKIENGIKYVKNALKARKFESIHAINEFLLNWEKTVADKRQHGTTKKQVHSHFENEENANLIALPSSLFESFSEGKRRVHRDSYVEVQKAYYDVPCEYIGRELWVRWDAKMIRIYDQKMNLLRSHARLEPGQFSQVLGVEGTRGSLEQSTYYWRSRIAGVGEGACLWADALIENRPAMAMRVMQGLLSKCKKHSKKQVDEACKKAHFAGQFRLREIEQLLHSKSEQPCLGFISEHELIRDTESYGKILSTKELF